MRNYEMVLMIHPDCGDQIPTIIDHYTNMINNDQGKIHRVENWGRRQLAYTIKKLNKAYYILLNIEVYQNTLNELSDDLRFNEMILRNIIIRTKCAVKEPSPMIKRKEENQSFNASEAYQKN